MVSRRARFRDAALVHGSSAGRYPLLLVGLVGLLALSLGACSGGKPPAADPVRPVRAMKVDDTDAITGRKFPGKAAPTEEVNLSFRVSGPLVARPADVGMVVSKGDLLAKIDPRDYEVALLSVEAQRDTARAQLKAMKVGASPEEVEIEVTDRLEKAVMELTALVLPFEEAVGAEQQHVPGLEVNHARVGDPRVSPRAEISVPVLQGVHLSGSGNVQVRGGSTPSFAAEPFNLVATLIFLLAIVHTYLSTLVPGFTDGLKYAVVAGAVTGGGLTVIANAPNPAGQAILKGYFTNGVSPIGLLKAALVPTVILFAMFNLLG